MISLAAKYKRSLAVLLSVWMIGMFATCLSICSMHSEVALEIPVVPATNQLDGEHDSGCCPITSPPISVLPERLSFHLQASNDCQISITIVTVLTDQVFRHYGRKSIQPPSCGPTLDRLCTLRI
jgi:hypothetical protein